MNAVVALVRELAAYEQASDQCHLTPAQLRTALFGEEPALFGHVAEVGCEVVAFALWFRNFSTWDGVHGIYLEDLFVRSEHRGCGLGRAQLAAECVRRGYSRLQWVGAGLERARDRLLPLDRRRTDERVDGLSHHRSDPDRTGKRSLTIVLSRRSGRNIRDETITGGGSLPGVQTCSQRMCCTRPPTTRTLRHRFLWLEWNTNRSRQIATSCHCSLSH